MCAGNAREPLLYIFGAVVLFCTLSGKWWIMAYLFGGLLLFGVVLLYTVYLEYNAQEYLGNARAGASNAVLSPQALLLYRAGLDSRSEQRHRQRPHKRGEHDCNR